MAHALLPSTLLNRASGGLPLGPLFSTNGINRGTGLSIVTRFVKAKTRGIGLIHMR